LTSLAPLPHRRFDMSAAEAPDAPEAPFNVANAISFVIEDLTADGDFAEGGKLLTPMPTLHVDGMGALPLPVSPEKAKELIALCSQAPYGHGADTIVDTKVRKSWQLAPEKVQFSSAGAGLVQPRLLTAEGVADTAARTDLRLEPPLV
jgi:hypothetical protein